MAGGYDTLISEAAEAQRDLLRVRQRVRYEMAVDSLIADPTLANSRVTLLDVREEATGDLSAETYALTWGDVVLSFAFMNSLVTVVLYVDVMEGLPPPAPPMPRRDSDGDQTAWRRGGPVL